MGAVEAAQKLPGLLGFFVSTVRGKNASNPRRQRDFVNLVDHFSQLQRGPFLFLFLFYFWVDADILFIYLFLFFWVDADIFYFYFYFYFYWVDANIYLFIYLFLLD